jgi:hypothetical protein
MDPHYALSALPGWARIVRIPHYTLKLLDIKQVSEKPCSPASPINRKYFASVLRAKQSGPVGRAVGSHEHAPGSPGGLVGRVARSDMQMRVGGCFVCVFVSCLVSLVLDLT